MRSSEKMRMEPRKHEGTKKKSHAAAEPVLPHSSFIIHHSAFPPHSSFILHPSSFRKAFSLVEIMIVVVIIGLLAGLVSYTIPTFMGKAKVNAAKADISTLGGGVNAFFLDKGRYPSNQEGLQIVVTEKFLPKIPLDPWGHPYQYLSPGRNGGFDIICYGADGREGGTGLDADISNADIEPAKK